MCFLGGFSTIREFGFSRPIFADTKQMFLKHPLLPEESGFRDLLFVHVLQLTVFWSSGMIPKRLHSHLCPSEKTGKPCLHAWHLQTSTGCRLSWVTLHSPGAGGRGQQPLPSTVQRIYRALDPFFFKQSPREELVMDLSILMESLGGARPH